MNPVPYLCRAKHYLDHEAATIMASTASEAAAKYVSDFGLVMYSGSRIIFVRSPEMKAGWIRVAVREVKVCRGEVVK